MMRRLRLLARSRRGAVALEFAIVAPVMLALLMGLGELAFQMYAQSVLTGAVQRAGRNDTLAKNAGNTDAVDAVVEKIVGSVVPNAQFNARSARRTNFDNYASMKGEPFVDTIYPNPGGTLDGICDHGETYTDLNNNGVYDSNLGQTGEGGATDVTQYTVTVTYNRLFPVARLIGLSNTVTLSATTIFKNQPYLTQTGLNTGTTNRTCS